MTVSMRLMHAGSGYRYLLKTVAAGDGNRDLSEPLTRYYAEKGTPPGYWLGGGLSSLDDPTVSVGERVTEQQLQLLLGYGVHPTTGEKLGRAFGRYRKTSERIAERVATLSNGLGDDARAAAIERIEVEEHRAGIRHAAAGYDFTMSVPKSVSVLWALADTGTQAMIAQAHHDAVAQVVDLLERDLVWTRTGKAGSVHADVTGVIATAFDHYDSRAGDPHLHTHVVISSKVARTDGGWYAIDGTPLHNATVAVSELQNAILADLMTRRFGVRWVQRDQGRDHNPSWEIDGVPDELLKEFSSRSCDIDVETDRLIASYAERYGRTPTKDTIIRLRQQATLTTRPEKTVQSLADLTRHWRDHAKTLLDEDPQAWAVRLLAGDSASEPLLRADDIPSSVIVQVAEATLAVVGSKRSTWRYWNLHAEASRQTTGWRFASDLDREAITALIAETAQTGSVKLTPDALAVPASLQRDDGTSRFHPKAMALFTSQAMLDAEDRLLALAQDVGGPGADTVVPNRHNRPSGEDAADETVLANRQPRQKTYFAGSPEQTVPRNPRNRFDADDRIENDLVETGVRNRQPRLHDGEGTVLTNRHNRPWERLSPDQQDAVWRIATSGLKLDVLVGPAGAGKTTTLAALRETWEASHGEGSVVGLAPSATAAQVLGEELGIVTENTAKWLTDHDSKGIGFQANQLVIVDEASLAGTFTLDRICGLAADAGAKVLLVGDWAQLQAVDAGGAFNLIVANRHDTPELSDIHRFSHDWEKAASLELRFSNPAAIVAYEAHGRIHGGDAEAMQQAAYGAWRADVSQGRQSVLIADDRATVAELNRQARHDRILAGVVDPTIEAHLAEGTRASVGDVVVTRRNDRRIVAGSTGWVRNGDRWTVTAINTDGSAIVRRAGYSRGASTVLPAAYVAEAVDLGYAITAHRAQGITVDTSHTVVSTATPRENLYVAMTRGRHANTAYVVTDTATDDTEHLGHEATTAAEVLAHVLRTSGAEPSAHQAKQDEHDHWLGVPQLMTECQQIIDEARRDWEALPDETRAHMLKASLNGSRTERRMIGGLIPEPAFPIAPEVRHALDVRGAVLDERLTTLAQVTLADQPAWLRELGPRPRDPIIRKRWDRALRTISAYRETYGIITDAALGDRATTTQQRIHHAVAAQHLHDTVAPMPSPVERSVPVQQPPTLGL